ncbi:MULTISPECIES: glycosyltransferase [unclassified Curtobacterium]|uniref:glycosyltransferase n=1 Tax=unclassified Curtobacterium TaxID=257496 RepID=UPI003826AC36
MTSPSRSVRVYPELRAAQVSRNTSLTPADGWYFSRNYDLGSGRPVTGFTHMTTFASLRFLAHGDVSLLEVPELLWARELPRTLALLFVHKCCTRGKSRRVFYAIENNAPRTALFGLKRWPAPVVSVALGLVGAAARILVDAIAFGSKGAEQAYTSLPFIRHVPSRLVEELPGRSDAVPASAAERHGAVFVGALEARKGITELCAAWEHVERAIPDCTVHVVGDGSLADEVRTWAAQDPRRRKFSGPIPHEEALRVIQRSTVLVAPSRREGRWREQVGLPIKEALAAGATIVTTADTGLASWLADHGHFVLDEGSAELAEAIEAALRHPLDAQVVVAALPADDGRVAADRWLHIGSGEER